MYTRFADADGGANSGGVNGDTAHHYGITNDKSQFNELARLGLQRKKGHIYKIEEAELPTNFTALYTALPVQVEFKRIISNILNARHIKKDEEWGKEGETMKSSSQTPNRLPSSAGFAGGLNNVSSIRHPLRKKRESEYEKWQRYLSLEENIAIVSDSFWYAISKFQEKRLARLLGGETMSQEEFQLEEKKFKNVQEKLLGRIARNYVNILLSIENKTDNNAFFKKFFDTIAQAVFYSFFYAFPKSRSEFNNELKADLINQFSYLFTGIQITNSFKYWSQWNLDLGAGNILAVLEKPLFGGNKEKGSGGGSTGGVGSSSKDSMALPSLSKGAQPRNKRVLMPIKFSPILDKYIHSYNYQTKNYVTGFKMKFSLYDTNKDAVEEKFKSYLDLADKIKEKSDEMIVQNNTSTRKMKEEIKKLKNETIKHHRRLEKRKQEELERGAHEYANYLVSMLDAGLARGNIGVINQNPLS